MKLQLLIAPAFVTWMLLVLGAAIWAALSTSTASIIVLVAVGLSFPIVISVVFFALVWYYSIKAYRRY